MLLVEAVLGNAREEIWKKRLAEASVDELLLDQWEAQKNRIRKPTKDGAEIALSLDRSSHLHDGDVLHWDEAGRKAIVVRINLQDVLVIQLNGLLPLSPALIAQTCFELGHALGNQHWPAVVKENRVYVPLTVDRNVMQSVMRTHAFTDITYEFVKGAEVIPYLAPHETRRLFGGADATPHAHAAAGTDGPSHSHTHPHSHPPHHHHHS